MPWERTDTVDDVTEWERTDRAATVRIRRRPDDEFVVRLDRLEQAPEGPAYERTTATDREAAEAAAAALRERYDTDAE